MGLRDRLKALIGRRSAASQKVVLRARLPSRIFADGSMSLTGVAADGLYGMARLTIHEAELSPALDAAANGDAPAQPSGGGRRGSKFYAVVSLGRQTFASRRVRAVGGTRDAKTPGRFVWDASAAVVLQRSGATLAQVAVYKAGRVDGALGDRLQCWATIDLASYFAEAEAEEEEHGEVASSPAPPAAQSTAAGPLPPALLRTEGAVTGESSSTLASDEGEGEGAERSAPSAASTVAPSTIGPGDGEVLQDVWLPLVDPGDSAVVCGRVRLSVRADTPDGLERQLWRRLLPLADLDGDSRLSVEEFDSLLHALGTKLSSKEVAALFDAADVNGDGAVDAQELAATLAGYHSEGEFHRLMTRCPVDGAQLLPNDDLANIIYVTLALDEGSGDSLKGGYTTPQQVSRSWLLSMTEWATQPLLGSTAALWRGNEYKAGGLRTGAAGAHILVFDRATKRVVEEAVSPGLTLAMRALYQTSEGALLLRKDAARRLKQMSEKYGARADSPDSAADITRFLQAFRGQLDMKEYVVSDPAGYRCFNDFFYRKIKPEARPIASAQDPGVIVSAADCRLTVFASVDDATRCWIKGRRFSVAGMLGDTSAAVGGAEQAPAGAGGEQQGDADGGPGGAAPGGAASGGGDSSRSMATSSSGATGEGPTAAEFAGGSMAIFRLAPQDYHRFHAPVAGVVASVRDIPGELLTVNPIAVNSPYADVFTRNKRSVLVLDAPGYGRVAYVAVGATVVGSIRWTVEVGQEVQKGEEVGYFAFGGSTIVLLFQAGAAQWDADLAANSLKSLETRVLMGERLGERGVGASVS